MIHDARAASLPRFAIRIILSRRPRARYRHPARPHTLLPVIGADDVILPTFDQTLGEFALRAQAGDLEARDALYGAFRPKLSRLLQPVRPPFAPAGAEGQWTREDVDQEGYIAFVELVDAWNGEVSFTAYVLSRFTWRVRDAISRGVGKPSAPPRSTVLPIEAAAPLAVDGELPLEARGLLEEVVASLAPPLDTVLVEHVVHGRTKAEICRELGISPRTMVRYWHRIRECTQEVLDGRPVW